MVGCAQICNLKLELKLSPTFCHFGTDACIMAVKQYNVSLQRLGSYAQISLCSNSPEFIAKFHNVFHTNFNMFFVNVSL